MPLCQLEELILAPDGRESLGFLEAAWISLMRTLDAGTMGGDAGWGFRSSCLCVTIGGVFVISTLIGVLTRGRGRQDRGTAQGPLARARRGPHRHPGLVAADLHHHLRSWSSPTRTSKAARHRHPGRPETRWRWKTRSATAWRDRKNTTRHLPLRLSHRPDRPGDRQPAYGALDHHPAARRRRLPTPTSSRPSWR